MKVQYRNQNTEKTSSNHPLKITKIEHNTPNMSKTYTKTVGHLKRQKVAYHINYQSLQSQGFWWLTKLVNQEDTSTSQQPYIIHSCVGGLPSVAGGEWSTVFCFSTVVDLMPGKVALRLCRPCCCRGNKITSNNYCHNITTITITTTP